MSETRAKYILRFDDICPTMNWHIWRQIEILLERYNIKPLLAVIPDCRDTSMIFEKPNEEFWAQVREWQSRGYDIALHGYSHVYTNKRAGIIGITRQSEFVGLSKNMQHEKISAGLKILSDNGVKTDIWIAPSHSFDYTTIDVLKDNGINYISDGFGESLFKFKGMIWLPCQLWDRIRLVQRDGIYTVCYHHSAWTDIDLRNFEMDLQKFHNQISSYSHIVNTYPVIEGRSWRHLYDVYMRKLKNFIKTILLR